MAFFTVQRNGFITVAEMMRKVIEDMSDNGFSVVFPVGYDPATPPTVPFRVVMAPNASVDPLFASQPWRVAFDITHEQVVAAYVATPLQILDDGTILPVVGGTGGTLYYAGHTGQAHPSLFPPTAIGSPVGLVNRAGRIPNVINGGSFPLNYRLTITDRGFFFGSFEGNWASSGGGAFAESNFNWMLVQRPVNKTTGEILTTGKAPVFCVNCVAGNYWRFVVRESDVSHPSTAVDAAAHTEDNFRLINKQNQVSITEEKTYLVSFMNNLNTPRFRYTEELDLLGIISADVIMEGIPVSMSVYGGTRTYTAMPGSESFNTGVRVMALTTEP